MKRIPAILLCLAVLSGTIIHADMTAVAPGEETSWIRYLIPLPKEISIPRRITLKPSEVSIVVPRDAGEIERNAAAELQRLFKEKTGAVSSGREFTIMLGVIDSKGELNGIRVRNAERLKSLPNNSQAYVIELSGGNTLLLAGLHPNGVFYAAATLSQLIEPFMTKQSIRIPLADVVDWPDIEERGLWNFQDPPSWIPWLSTLKLNYGKMAGARIHRVERGKPNNLTIDSELMMKSRLYGFNYVPFIMHFNFLHGYGLFREYPELAGVGDGALSGRYFAHKSGPQHRVPCTSNPLFTDILTEWMMAIADQGANDVSVWLSERPAQCGCKDCTEVGQFVLEARASNEAYRRVREKYPDFISRLFLSTTTTERYWRVLAEAPPEVRIERACASWLERVPHSPRDLYINPLLDKYASEGRWIANYDVPLGSYGRVDTPEFKIPCSSAHRIRDFVRQLAERDYSGAYGMMAWNSLGRETYGFNINALAEWSWNVNGRSEREFALAWATREGYADPEAVAEWSEIMGPVEFDVYDSEFPVSYSWGQAVQMVEERKRPYLGEGIFRYYSDPDDFDRKLDSCDRALAIAGKFENPYFANETAVVRSYVNLAKHIYLIAEQVATDDLATLESQAILRSSLDGLRRAGEENVQAIRIWRSAVGTDNWHWRVQDAIKGTETTVEGIVDIIQSKYFF